LENDLPDLILKKEPLSHDKILLLLAFSINYDFLSESYWLEFLRLLPKLFIDLLLFYNEEFLRCSIFGVGKYGFY
jgi:hypothetical protein